ncbi:protein mono-ADP-ribosyltransferase PARP16-like [Babylonia areolata]|uniref:protein mono-ADP-ribosyltransferase PARP16-like n=1 Tax=Babylonia areolata TaxID=304850 RepID=UPI003FD50791
MSGSREELKRIVLGKIREDPLAADLRWSLFVAALQSYRCDSVLRPFPPRFHSENEEKDTDRLKEAAADIPGVLQLSLKVSTVSDEALELLAWVLDDPSFRLITKNKTEYTAIKKLTGHMTSVPDPSYIFEVQYGETGEKKFQALREGRKLMYAYHGSRIENFHSILHNGLAGHMNKMSLFGKGTYLSSELAVSMLYSPGGQGWKKSQLGSNLGCVAVCQMVDDPSVKCTVKEGGSISTEGEENRGRARAAESLAGDVPERYYVVENNDMVRVKYLLLYSQPTTASTQRSAHAMPWYRKNKFAVMMAIYMLLLLCIGLFSSKSFQFYIRRWLKSYGFTK